MVGRLPLALDMCLASVEMWCGQVGMWDQDQVLLTVQMISTVQIFAGVPACGARFHHEWQERVRFFIERDQDFQLPGT